MKESQVKRGYNLSDLKKLRAASFKKLLKAVDDGYKIIYVDETEFRPYSIYMKSWAPKGQN